MIHRPTPGLILFVASHLLGGCCVAAAAGDFGLAYSVPGFDTSFRSGIGSGVVAIVKANATLLKYDANHDWSGATTALYGVATNLTSPLNKVLGHVAAAFGANGTDALQALTDELQATVPATTAALEQASTTVRSLQGTVRTAVVESLLANVSTIAGEVETFARNWAPFAQAVKVAGSPESTYDGKSISSLITPANVQSVTGPILKINAALMDISNTLGTIAKDRTVAIGYETATNTSIQNAQQDLTGSVALANRTLTDTGRQMEQQTNATVRQVREGYAPFLNRLVDELETTRVKTFLETVDTQGLEYNRRVAGLLDTVAGNYTRLIRNAGDTIGGRLHGATVALIDAATMSDGGHADRCLQRYVGDFRQTSYAATRLSTCYQVDARTISYLTAANGAFLDQLRNGAVYGNQAQTVCAQASTGCTTVYLESLENVGIQNQVRMDNFIGFLREEMVALHGRYDVCARAIRTDLEHLVEATNEKFRNCLQTGR